MGEEFFNFGWKILEIVPPFYCHRLRGSSQLDSWNNQVNVQTYLPNVTNLNEQLSFDGTHWPFLVNARRVCLPVKRQNFYFSSRTKQFHYNSALAKRFWLTFDINFGLWSILVEVTQDLISWNTHLSILPQKSCRPRSRKSHILRY